MRHIACQTTGCPNIGAPFHDFEPDETIVLCPHCGKTMTKIAAAPSITDKGGEA